MAISSFFRYFHEDILSHLAQNEKNKNDNRTEGTVKIYMVSAGGLLLVFSWLWQTNKQQKNEYSNIFKRATKIRFKEGNKSKECFLFQ